MIEVGSDFSGVGALDQALMYLGIPYKTVFDCDMDKYSRRTFILNNGSEDDVKLLEHEDVIFCDNIYYKYVNSKLRRPTISEYKKLLRIQEKTARMFSFYYPWNVYYRKIPEKPLDLYVTSPPCQGFSIAGKREGSILFYNSHEFIKKNKPRYFIFENVKGLLSHDKKNKDNKYGNTFNIWLSYLGGKSVNNNATLFPHEESLPYHIYHSVLNAKDYGVAQNRERIFIIGIRDDVDNNFKFPKPIHLEKRIKDYLESNVPEKYYLSQKMIDGFINKKNSNSGYINQDTQASQVYSDEGVIPSLCAGTHGYANGYVFIGASRGRCPENPKSRVAGLPTSQMLEINKNGIANTLTTVQKDNLVVYRDRIRKLTPRECFRLMGFPESYKIVVSDSQAYKQAGNSIVREVLAAIIKNLLGK